MQADTLPTKVALVRTCLGLPHRELAVAWSKPAGIEPTVICPAALTGVWNDLLPDSDVFTFQGAIRNLDHVSRSLLIIDGPKLTRHTKQRAMVETLAWEANAVFVSLGPLSSGIDAANYLALICNARLTGLSITGRSVVT